MTSLGYGKGLHALVPSLTWQCDPQVDAVAAAYGGSSAVVVDLGAGGRRIVPHVIAVDVARLPGTDVAARVEQLPFAAGSVDLVFATGLLEHVLDERPVLDEIARILRPGGRVHVELPFLQHYHDDPIDSRRYTGPGLVRLLEQHGFTPESSGCHIGPTVGLLMMLSYYAQLLVEGPGRTRRLLANAAFLAVRLVGWPLKFLDDWLAKKPSAHRLACGVYCTARKPEAPPPAAVPARTRRALAVTG